MYMIGTSQEARFWSLLTSVGLLSLVRTGMFKGGGQRESIYRRATSLDSSDDACDLVGDT